MKIRSMVGCAAAALLLAACGKEGTDEGAARVPVVEVKAGDQVIKLKAGGDLVAPIAYDFPKAGRYTLTMTGQLQIDGPGEALVSFDSSGKGVFSAGVAQQSYTITLPQGQTIPINQTATLDVESPGPWQMRVHVQTFSVGGTLSNIQLKIVS